MTSRSAVTRPDDVGPCAVDGVVGEQQVMFENPGTGCGVGDGGFDRAGKQTAPEFENVVGTDLLEIGDIARTDAAIGPPLVPLFGFEDEIGHADSHA